MAEELLKGELVERNEEGKLVLAAQVENLIDLCEGALQEAQSNYDFVKQALITAMLNNNIKTANVGKYKFAVREPKEKWNFDVDRFINEENEDIVVAFSNLETTTTETFDMEKFKTECPDIYAKYLVKKTEEKLVVDENKLWSTLRKVWEKYATKEEPKPATITIKKVGE